MKKFIVYFVGVVVFYFIGFGVATEMNEKASEPATTQVSVDKSKEEKKEPVKKEEPKKEKKPVKKEVKKDDKTFKFGDEVSFTSGLKIKAVSTKTTTERNQFEEPVKHVVVADVEITNTTDTEVNITSYDLNIQDKDGFQGKPYPGGDQFVTIAPKGKAKIKFHYGIDGSGPYKVIASDVTWK